MIKDITTLYSYSPFTINYNDKVYTSIDCFSAGHLIDLKPFKCCYLKIKSTDAIIVARADILLEPFSQAWCKIYDKSNGLWDLELVTSNHEIAELELTSFS